MAKGQIPTHQLVPGEKTAYWVGISGNPSERVSPNGANSLGVESSLLRGKKISEIERLVKDGWRLVGVGLVKIYFKPV